MFFSA
jgi:hypothetical protein